MRSVDPRPVRRGPYPEFTLTSLVVGYVIGALITVAVGYSCLILGFAIQGSELAAILGWGVLRGLLGRRSIVENNINQTVASAVNGASAGMMFSVPALFILRSDLRFGDAEQLAFEPALLVLACITGGVLGISFVVPLRKQMIDFNRLVYPSGVAVAVVLKSPGVGARKANLLIVSAVVSAVAHLVVTQGLNLPRDAWSLGAVIGLPRFLDLTFYLSLLTVGVGFLSGRGGLVVAVGSFVCNWGLVPLLAVGGEPAVRRMVFEQPEALRSALFVPAGVGVLVGAAVGGVVVAFPAIRSAVRSLSNGSAANSTSAEAPDELPIRYLYVAIGVAAAALTLFAYLSTPGMAIWRAIAMAVAAMAWIWVAGVMVADCLGRTNWPPLSGMTLVGTTGLLFFASGLSNTQTVIASVTVGSAMCVAVAMAADMMLDLKSGYLTGASPRAQQLSQLAATWLGPILIMGLILVLDRAYGFGNDRLPAPQSRALAATISSVIGGDAQMFRYGAGAIIGLVLASSGYAGMGVYVGLSFYMPFPIVLTYAVGVGLRTLVDRTQGPSWSQHTGVPMAAGLLVGEAAVGVCLAIGRVVMAVH